jgi:HEAT repeat protein
MTMPSGAQIALPATQVEELLRTIVKGLRAFQMYLPNNPIYQRAEQAIHEAFLPIWSATPSLTLSVVESDFVWEEQVVYHQPSRAESFAWMLYKDGMRVLTLRPGVEDGEMVRFLQVVTRARLLAADASDDLLTLLWEQEFSCIDYQFAEVIIDSGVVLDPQMEQLGPATAAAQPEVKEEVRADALDRPPGLIDLEDFDTTLYFLDEKEILDLKRQVDEEYSRDVRKAAHEALLDTFELQAATAVRDEVLSIFESLFPNLLTKGEFRTVAWLLREFRTIAGRVTVLEASQRKRLDAFQDRLSEPEILSQLLQSLEDAGTLPEDEGVGDVLSELHAGGLETMLVFLRDLKSPAIRQVLEASVDRLGGANVEAVLRIFESGSPPAIAGAIALCRRLRLQQAVPGLDRLLSHREAEIRVAAVEALEALGTPGALAALERALDDSDRTVRLAAVTAVTRSGSRGALRRLEAVVQGKGPRELERAERRQYFEAYAVLAGAPALPMLASLLQPGGLFKRGSTPEIRTCAAYAVAKLGTPEARAVLERVQNDKELAVRNAASRALREWPA